MYKVILNLNFYFPERDMGYIIVETSNTKMGKVLETGGSGNFYFLILGPVQILR